jgi:hypothetical protein
LQFATCTCITHGTLSATCNACTCGTLDTFTSRNVSSWTRVLVVYKWHTVWHVYTVHMANCPTTRVPVYTYQIGHVFYYTRSELTRGQLSNTCTSIHVSNWTRILLYTWRIVQFATTESTTYWTRPHLHVANGKWPISYFFVVGSFLDHHF